MVAFAGNLPELRVGGWLRLLSVAGAGGEVRAVPGFGVLRAHLAVRVRVGAVGWESGGGLPVTSAYLWDRSPY
jgi:hypothetical protein